MSTINKCQWPSTHNDNKYNDVWWYIIFLHTLHGACTAHLPTFSTHSTAQAKATISSQQLLLGKAPHRRWQIRWQWPGEAGATCTRLLGQQGTAGHPGWMSFPWTCWGRTTLFCGSGFNIWNKCRIEDKGINWGFLTDLSHPIMLITCTYHQS